MRCRETQGETAEVPVRLQEGSAIVRHPATSTALAMAGEDSHGNRKGFSLTDFGKSVLSGGLTGGLASLSFYRAGKAFEGLRDSVRVNEVGSDVVKNNFLNNVKDIRAQMPNTNLAKRGNMAVADFSYLKPENERIFTAYVDDQYPRYYDTEAKILEDIASQITDPNVSGTINLYSGLPCCQSYSNIILEFRKMFPNIELNIFVE